MGNTWFSGGVVVIGGYIEEPVSESKHDVNCADINITKKVKDVDRL